MPDVDLIAMASCEDVGVLAVLAHAIDAVTPRTEVFGMLDSTTSSMHVYISHISDAGCRIVLDVAWGVQKLLRIEMSALEEALVIEQYRLLCSLLPQQRIPLSGTKIWSGNLAQRHEDLKMSWRRSLKPDLLEQRRNDSLLLQLPLHDVGISRRRNAIKDLPSAMEPAHDPDVVPACLPQHSPHCLPPKRPTIFWQPDRKSNSTPHGPELFTGKLAANLLDHFLRGHAARVQQIFQHSKLACFQEEP